MIIHLRPNIKSAWQTMPSAGTGTKDDPLYWNETGQAQEGYFYIDLPSTGGEYESSVDAWVYGKFEQGQSYDFRAVAMEGGLEIKIYDAENNQVASGHFDDMEYKLVLDFEPETTGIYYFHITCDWAMGEPAIGVNPAPVAITPYIERTAGKAHTEGFNEQGRAILYNNIKAAGLLSYRYVDVSDTVFAIVPSKGIKDASKNSINLTNNGEVFIEDKALIFNNTGQYLQCDKSDSLNLGTAWSFEIDFEGIKTAYYDAIISNGASNHHDSGFAINYKHNNHGNNLGITWAAVGGDPFITSSSLLDNERYIALITCNGASVKIYINGILDKEQQTSPSPLNMNRTYGMRIGQAWDGSGSQFNGKIYSIRVWDKAINPSEV